MFERFTQEARAVVALAVEEAGALGADRRRQRAPAAGRRRSAGRRRARARAARARTRRAARRRSSGRGGLDADALAAIGIDLAEVRRRVEESFGPGALGGRRQGRRPFAPEAKKSLELSLREALALGDRRHRRRAHPARPAARPRRAGRRAAARAGADAGGRPRRRARGALARRLTSARVRAARAPRSRRGRRGRRGPGRPAPARGAPASSAGSGAAREQRRDDPAARVAVGVLEALAAARPRPR